MFKKDIPLAMPINIQVKDGPYYFSFVVILSLISKSCTNHRSSILDNHLACFNLLFAKEASTIDQ